MHLVLVMARPVVLVAYDPPEPEEANAVQEELEGVAEVRWLHGSDGRLENAAPEEVDALVCFHWPKGLDDALPLMERLRLVQRVPAGVEGFPFEVLEEARPDVTVAGGSGSNADWVAEHAFALLLACAKRVAFHDRTMRRGEFHQTDVQSKELGGANLGIVGYGAIGRRVGALGEAFGMDVVGLRRAKEPGDGPEVLEGLEALPALLGKSDFVVVSLPLSDETRGAIGKDELQGMRSGAVLVNVSRGAVIDEEALYDHLSLHPDFYAGLDVWWDYPKDDERFAQSQPFHELPNVVMTPHAAAMVPGFRARMARFAARNVRAFLEGEKISGVAKVEDYVS